MALEGVRSAPQVRRVTAAGAIQVRFGGPTQAPPRSIGTWQPRVTRGDPAPDGLPAGEAWAHVARVEPVARVPDHRPGRLGVVAGTRYREHAHKGPRADEDKTPQSSVVRRLYRAIAPPSRAKAAPVSRADVSEASDEFIGESLRCEPAGSVRFRRGGGWLHTGKRVGGRTCYSRDTTATQPHPAQSRRNTAVA